jgi:hypothetical protein
MSEFAITATDDSPISAPAACNQLHDHSYVATHYIHIIRLATERVQ